MIVAMNSNLLALSGLVGGGLETRNEFVLQRQDFIGLVAVARWK